MAWALLVYGCPDSAKVGDTRPADSAPDRSIPLADATPDYLAHLDQRLDKVDATADSLRSSDSSIHDSARDVPKPDASKPQWTALASGTIVSLSGVWGLGPSDLYVGGSSTLRHFDGLSWKSVTLPFQTKTYSIWGTGTSDIFVAGSYGTATHFNGQSWTQHLSGTSGHLYDIWGSSGSDVYVPGYGGIYLHYNGTSWTNVTLESSYEFLYSVSGTGPNDIYIVGTQGLHHFNGNTWSLLLPAAGNSWHLVWCAPKSSKVFLISYNGKVNVFDGSNWTQSAIGTTHQTKDVWGSSASDIFVVGDNGSIFHFDGQAWTKMSSGTSVNLNGVWGFGPSDVFAVGDSGTVLRYTP